MFEYSCRFGTVDAVATQGEHAGDLGLFEHVECLVDVILVQILRGQMGTLGMPYSLTVWAMRAVNVRSDDLPVP